MDVTKDKELSSLLSELSEENSIKLMKRFNKIMRWVIADFPKFTSHKYPDKHGLIYFDGKEERKYTYKELDSLSNRFANFLIENGLNDYDRVALHSFNSDYFVISMFGTYKAKGVLVPINYLLTGKDVVYQINNSESKFYILDDAFYDQIKDVLSEFNFVKKYVGINQRNKIKDNKFIDFKNIINSYTDKEPDKILNIWDPVTIMYTSGTESLPKGVIHTNQSLISEYVSSILSGRFESRDAVIHALPLYHCAQKDVFLVPYIWIGATNIILPKGDIQLIMESIEKYKANSMFAPPTVWIGIINHPDFKKYDLSSIEKIYYGAAIMPVEILNKLRKEFPNAKFVNYYGQTELAPAHTALLPEDHEKKPGTAGKELLNMITELMDDNGNIINEPYKPGEIVGRGPHTMLGYLKNEEKTLEAFAYGWFHSGDIGMWDSDHYLYVVDRKKDMIKTGGENVSSREVEEVIYKHPAVKEVAVIGLPDEKWIEKVTAIVVLKDGYEKSDKLKNEIIEYSRNNLAHFKAPKDVIFVDSLPKSPSGKILKRELREMFKATKEFKKET
ncbi:acyl-CoA synthetase (AMP-forming)/AMP-acid ligase II [Caldisphaera lagunensis DSM 15908]|uniref:Acyl-CoA synthetase (AMP-forming)/AMP-acid ligase II n=1 Tax=Caldisphaera lagunensis (strain DSM 15908 / JCM 11604 / ANMR 0165 / IC-154) TaxID=1056495 RepID=L0AA20_CALLD|nr:fatty acyl-CoA synthetase [Caldisphaera lagunensis]AFZ69977.1 acyl-CoA synthetase (AMP-forming)/AMP-acid ligase II [Caldisphaera lagunensis DSM 15908]